jgi:dienelactone hydrolase
MRHLDKGDGHPVLVVPGYGASDRATAPLRYFLNQIGYTAFALEAGRNVEGAEDRIRSVDDASRFRDQLVEVVVDRVREIFESTTERVTLIGWSMGGLHAFDASQKAPEVTRGVITMGAPFGDLRGTSVFNLMRRLSGSAVPLEEQDFDGWLQKACAPAVPTTVIYSDRDGIVGKDIAKLPESEMLQSILVDSSHLGFNFNTDVLAQIARVLAENNVSTQRASL